jgi:hypothetical protein
LANASNTRPRQNAQRGRGRPTAPTGERGFGFIKRDIPKPFTATQAREDQGNGLDRGRSLEDQAGVTPLELRVWCDEDGTFHNFGSSDFVIRVNPVRAGQSAHTKTKNFNPRTYRDTNDNPSVCLTSLSCSRSFAKPELV